MSLVNKMLRDLDARRAGENERTALPAAVTPLAARQAPAPLWPKLVVAGLIAVASSAAAWKYWGASSAPPPPQAVAPSPAPGGGVAPEVASAPVLAAVSPAPTFPGANPAEAVSAAPGKSEAPKHERDVGPKSAASPPASRPEPRAKQEPRPEAKAGATLESRAASEPLPPVATSPAKPLMKGAPGSLPPADASSRIDKQERVPTPAERAEAFYRQGREAQRAGRADEALTSYQAALAVFPEQAAARQALAALLIEARRWEAAEQVLREGIELPAARLASTLTLARVLVERSQAAAALELMEKQAASGERNAEYQGFLAVLLNRAGRAHEAAERYQAATRLAPGEARWWAGLGIALEADGQGAAAREAYLKARSLPGLPPELAQHIEQRLR